MGIHDVLIFFFWKLSSLMRLCTKKLSYKLRWAACLIPSVMPNVETFSSFTAAGGRLAPLAEDSVSLACLFASVCSHLLDIDFGWHLVHRVLNFFFFFKPSPKERQEQRRPNHYPSCQHKTGSGNLFCRQRPERKGAFSLALLQT